MDINDYKQYLETLNEDRLKDIQENLDKNKNPDKYNLLVSRLTALSQENQEQIFSCINSGYFDEENILFWNKEERILDFFVQTKSIVRTTLIGTSVIYIMLIFQDIKTPLKYFSIFGVIVFIKILLLFVCIFFIGILLDKLFLAKWFYVEKVFQVQENKLPIVSKEGIKKVLPLKNISVYYSEYHSRLEMIDKYQNRYIVTRKIGNKTGKVVWFKDSENKALSIGEVLKNYSSGWRMFIQLLNEHNIEIKTKYL